ncbi:hypothetical protein TorRG33x02_173170 [Trema orientale]|uniref:Uncharacterized protein n=1 Tax=Trema orientale TaxID=63057 RepID=A0A2P5EN23_TREOI|nr:hypothetical protein TorRG33x02_173170 [Trema orientale]
MADGDDEALTRLKMVESLVAVRRVSRAKSFCSYAATFSSSSLRATRDVERAGEMFADGWQGSQNPLLPNQNPSQSVAMDHQRG